jgi:hypothetical protein
MAIYLLLVMTLRPHLRTLNWFLDLWSSFGMLIVAIVLLIAAADSLSFSQLYLSQYLLVLVCYLIALGYALMCLPGFIALLSRAFFGPSYSQTAELRRLAPAKPTSD